MSDLAKKSIDRRNGLDLAQSKLAKAVGVHHSITGQYERDEAKPTIDVDIAIAKALNTTVGYLLGENENAEFFQNTAMLKRFKDLNQLDADDRSALLKNIDTILRDAKTIQAHAE